MGFFRKWPLVSFTLGLITVGFVGHIVLMHFGAIHPNMPPKARVALLVYNGIVAVTVVYCARRFINCFSSSGDGNG